MAAGALALPAQAQEPEQLAITGEGVRGAPVSARREGPGHAVGPVFERMERAGLDLHQRNLVLAGATGAAFALYGWNKWWDRGFSGDFRVGREGWFGSDTQYGGTDKLGHLFTNYASTRLLAQAFEAAGNGREDSIRLAAWTSLGIFTGIEVLDGLSRDFRFGPEDALANAAGVGLGVLMLAQPGLDERFDFRFAYRPSTGSRFDPFGDYAGQRYLVVAKADGFPDLRRHRVLRYLELGIGYQARFTPGGERRRDLYVGVSLNLSRLLADTAYQGNKGTTATQRAAETAFEFIQFPAGGYTRHRLD